LPIRPVGERPVGERPVGERPVYFDGDLAAASVYWRPSLPAGAVVDGPAVIEEYGATVPVHPGFTVSVDELGNLIVRRTA
jgi:N-methylhydantoinase A